MITFGSEHLRRRRSATTTITTALQSAAAAVSTPFFNSDEDPEKREKARIANFKTGMYWMALEREIVSVPCALFSIFSPFVNLLPVSFTSFVESSSSSYTPHYPLTKALTSSYVSGSPAFSSLPGRRLLMFARLSAWLLSAQLFTYPISISQIFES